MGRKARQDHRSWRGTAVPLAVGPFLALVLTGLCALPLFARSASAQLALPITVPAATLSVGSPEVTYTVDLSTLPLRPIFFVEAIADANHADMVLQVELSNWVEDWDAPPIAFPPGSAQIVFIENQTLTSDPAAGQVNYEYPMLAIDPRSPTNTWINASVDVTIRALSFGTTGAPANVEILIGGRTQVPFGTLTTEVIPNTISQSLELTPSKDTTIYRRAVGNSNGAGTSIWAGTDVTFDFPFANRRDAVNGLLAFDLQSALPAGATIDDATLTLFASGVLGGGGNLSVYRTATSVLASWDEGTADGGSADFTGAISPTPAANWLHRSNTSRPWAVPGGGPLGPLIDSNNITGVGFYDFSSTSLTAEVQDMLDTQTDDDGFVLVGPGNFLSSFDTAVQLVSRDSSVGIYHPKMSVDFTQTVTESSGDLNVGALLFITEGEDFRWLYDEDEDGILRTDIDGVCTVLPSNAPYSQGLPYTYTYEGTPGFVGVDCCTWQISSPNTGTTGTGQALFFHGLDPNFPANVPPDTDGDGILDGCDNCPYTPNGPALGTCVDTSGNAGPTCQSDLDCLATEECQQSQQDLDGSPPGLACPEPGFAVGSGLACGLLSWFGRRRRSESRSDHRRHDPIRRSRRGR